MTADYEVAVIGGGLAGLTLANLLCAAGRKVLLIEKKNYPFHKVCGEYVSNEVLGFLQRLGFNPFDLGARPIKRLRISTPSGRNLHTTLPLGGFGLSRYRMDTALYELALSRGLQALCGSRVQAISGSAGRQQIQLASGQSITARLVIACHGKRDLLDKRLERGFMHQRSRYLGVKYHIETDYPADEIGLDTFKGGYCGIAPIEQGRFNLCYLYQRPKYGPGLKPEALEAQVLAQNPVLARIFEQASFVNRQPLAIHEISFAPKEQVMQDVLMCGDSAGLITPLCGNGMAMAISGARMLAALILERNYLGQAGPEAFGKLAADYEHHWNALFGRRLRWGRRLQPVLSSSMLSRLCLPAIHAVPSLEQWLLKQTHGNPLI